MSGTNACTQGTAPKERVESNSMSAGCGSSGDGAWLHPCLVVDTRTHMHKYYVMYVPILPKHKHAGYCSQ